MEGLNLDQREIHSVRKHGVGGSSCWYSRSCWWQLSFLKALAQNGADWVGNGLEDGVKVWNTCAGKWRGEGT